MYVIIFQQSAEDRNTHIYIYIYLSTEDTHVHIVLPVMIHKGKQDQQIKSSNWQELPWYGLAIVDTLMIEIESLSIMAVGFSGLLVFWVSWSLGSLGSLACSSWMGLGVRFAYSVRLRVLGDLWCFQLESDLFIAQPTKLPTVAQ